MLGFHYPGREAEGSAGRQTGVGVIAAGVLQQKGLENIPKLPHPGTCCVLGETKAREVWASSPAAQKHRQRGGFGEAELGSLAPEG